MKPALAAFALRAAVPDNRQRLVTPAGETRDQILLQRMDPEGVGDLVVGQLAVQAVGAHHEPVAASEELDSTPSRTKHNGVGKVAADTLLAVDPASPVVMRNPTTPELLVAGPGSGADASGGNPAPCWERSRGQADGEEAGPVPGTTRRKTALRRQSTPRARRRQNSNARLAT